MQQAKNTEITNYKTWVIITLFLAPLVVGLLGAIYGDRFLPSPLWSKQALIISITYITVSYLVLFILTIKKAIANEEGQSIWRIIQGIISSFFILLFLGLIFGWMLNSAIESGLGKALTKTQNNYCYITKNLEKYWPTGKSVCVRGLRPVEQSIVRWCISKAKYEELPETFAARIYGKNSYYGFIMEDYSMLSDEIHKDSKPCGESN